MAALTTKTKSKTALWNMVTDAADTLIDRVLLEVQAVAEDFCNRRLLYGTFTETFDGDGATTIRVKGLPIRTLTSVTIDDEAVDLADVEVNYALGEIYYDAAYTAGYQNVVIVYTAGYDIGTVGKEPPADLEGAIIAECVTRYENYSTETRVGENLVDLRTRFLSAIARATFDRWRIWHV